MKFHVDLGVGDEVLEPLESVKGRRLARFRGHPPPLWCGRSLSNSIGPMALSSGAEYLERDLAIVADIVPDVRRAGGLDGASLRARSAGMWGGEPLPSKTTAQDASGTAIVASVDL